VEYSNNPYGDNFADIYDEWYRDLDNIDEVVALVLSLAENGSVYELGIGTGRLALPIALAGESNGVVVSGIDSSQAMLNQLTAKPRAELITATLGHMVRDMAPGPFSVVPNRWHQADTSLSTVSYPAPTCQSTAAQPPIAVHRGVTSQAKCMLTSRSK
jgi:SAM-dependent methyltransferase